MQNRRTAGGSGLHNENAVYYSISCSPGKGKTAWNFNLKQTIGEIMHSIETLLKHKGDFSFDISIFYDDIKILNTKVKGKNLSNFVQSKRNRATIRLVHFDSANEDNMTHKWSNLATMSAKHKKVLYIDTDVYFVRNVYYLFKPMLDNPKKAVGVQPQPWHSGPPKPQNITHRYFVEKEGLSQEELEKTLHYNKDKQHHQNGTYAGHALFNTELLPNFSEQYRKCFNSFSEFAGTVAPDRRGYLINGTKDTWVWQGSNQIEELCFHLAICQIPRHMIHLYTHGDIAVGAAPGDFDHEADTPTPKPHTPDTCFFKKRGVIMHHTVRKFSHMYVPEQFSPDGWLSSCTKAKCEWCSVV